LHSAHQTCVFCRIRRSVISRWPSWWDWAQSNIGENFVNLAVLYSAPRCKVNRFYKNNLAYILRFDVQLKIAKFIRYAIPTEITGQLLCVFFFFVRSVLVWLSPKRKSSFRRLTVFRDSNGRPVQTLKKPYLANI